MGQSVDVFEFDDAPPGHAAFLQLLRRYVEPTGIDHYVVAGRRVELSCGVDPYTRPYACALLTELGGRFLAGESGLPGTLRLPWFSSLPLHDLPLGARLKIALGRDRSTPWTSGGRGPIASAAGEFADDGWYYDSAETEPDRSTGMTAVDRVYCLDWDQFTASHHAALGALYARLPGALPSTRDVPRWYGVDEDSPPYLLASIEPPGLQVTGELPARDWTVWDRRFRDLASGFPRKEPPS